MNNMRAYLALQSVEMLGHYKWLQRTKPEVTAHEAHIDWVVCGRAAEFSDQFDQHQHNLGSFCRDYCHGAENCHGVNHCPVDMDTLHAYLKGEK